MLCLCCSLKLNDILIFLTLKSQMYDINDKHSLQLIVILNLFSFRIKNLLFLIDWVNLGNKYVVRLAEWSKAWDLSSHNRKIAWVRTPHLAYNFFLPTWGALNCFVSHLDWLQWRNRLAHGTYRQCNEECRGCEFEPHLEQHLLIQK